MNRLRDKLYMRIFIVILGLFTIIVAIGCIVNLSRNQSYVNEYIKEHYWQAFDNPNSMFYSCNTGTDVNGWGTNFAQYWVNLVGGRTWAAQERTDYENIMNEIFSNKWTRGKLFSTQGSDNYPSTSSGNPFGYFY